MAIHPTCRSGALCRATSCTALLGRPGNKATGRQAAKLSNLTFCSRARSLVYKRSAEEVRRSAGIASSYSILLTSRLLLAVFPPLVLAQSHAIDLTQVLSAFTVQPAAPMGALACRLGARFHTHICCICKRTATRQSVAYMCEPVTENAQRPDRGRLRAPVRQKYDNPSPRRSSSTVLAATSRALAVPSLSTCIT